MKDRTTSIVKILTIGAVVAVLAPPVVNAATNNVKIQDADSREKAQVKNGALKISDGGGAMNVTGNVKAEANVQDSEGHFVNSQEVPPMGLFDATGSTGSIDVNAFAGGGGFLGAGDCTEEQENVPPGTNPGATPQDNESTISPDGDAAGDVIVTGILLTGSGLSGADPAGQIRVYSQTVANGALPLLRFQVNASQPNAVFSSPGGITLTANMTFRCTGGNGQYVILGQGDPADPTP